MMNRKIVVLIAVLITPLFLLGCIKESSSSSQTIFDGTAALFGISGVSNNHVWAVGEKGFITFYNGKKWTDSEKITEDNLYGVSALDKNHVWAVGNDGVILFFNGSKWSIQRPESGGRLRSVSALDENHVWAVGEFGEIFFFNGNSWSKQNSGVIWNMHGVSAVDTNHVWAVGSGGILFFNGQNWELQWESGISDVFLSLESVSAVGVNNVWTCGTVGYYPTILFYNGTEWQEQYRSNESIVPFAFEGSSEDVGLIRSIHATDKTHAYAVGYNFLLSFDGTEWKSKNIEGKQLQGVSTVDSKIWTVGYIVENFYKTGTTVRKGMVEFYN